MYANLADYSLLSRNVKPIAADSLEGCLLKASEDIDSLTFNRIVGKGFSNLSTLQQKLVKQAVVDQADFNYEYGGVVGNPLASYSINGVSMSWDSDKVMQMSGIFTTSSIYGLLRQTGLTYRGVR